VVAFSFAFKMRDFLPTWDREGGFRDRPSEEGAKSRNFDLRVYLFPGEGGEL
jgi:hypothetical protein